MGYQVGYSHAEKENARFLFISQNIKISNKPSLKKKNRKIIMA